MKEGGQELHIKFGLALLDLGIRNGQGKVVRVASLGVALQEVVGEKSHTNITNIPVLRGEFSS